MEKGSGGIKTGHIRPQKKQPTAIEQQTVRIKKQKYQCVYGKHRNSKAHCGLYFVVKDKISFSHSHTLLSSCLKFEQIFVSKKRNPCGYITQF